MANIKKELKSLISRFDAAQEAFAANSTDVKKLNKKHKKAMKSLKAELSAARIEIEALKAELAIAKLGAPVKPVPSSKPAPKRRGRPAGSKSKSKAKAAPKAAEKITAAKPKAKRRGRPAGSKNKTTSGAKRGPGRPRTKPKKPASPLQAITGVGPAMAKQFEAAGVSTPAQMAKLSNTKMAAILENCGPRYRNATPEKMNAYREAAKAAK